VSAVVERNDGRAVGSVIHILEERVEEGDNVCLRAEAELHLELPVLGLDKIGTNLLHGGKNRAADSRLRS
jgi:hypothetical protein